MCMETLLIGRRGYSIGVRNSFALSKILYILFFTFTLCVRICPWSQFSPTMWGLGVSLRSPGLAVTAFIHSAIFLAWVYIFLILHMHILFLTFLTFSPIQKENLIELTLFTHGFWCCLFRFGVCVVCYFDFVHLFWYLRQPRLISNFLSNWG